MLVKIWKTMHPMQSSRCRCVNCHLSVLSGRGCTSLRYVHEGLSVCVGHWMHLPVICASWANGSERHIYINTHKQKQTKYIKDSAASKHLSMRHEAARPNPKNLDRFVLDSVGRGLTSTLEHAPSCWERSLRTAA